MVVDLAAHSIRISSSEEDLTFQSKFNPYWPSMMADFCCLVTINAGAILKLNVQHHYINALCSVASAMLASVFQGLVQSGLFGYFWMTLSMTGHWTCQIWLTVTVTTSNRLLLVQLHSKTCLDWLQPIKFMQNYLLIIKYILSWTIVQKNFTYNYCNKNYFLQYINVMISQWKNGVGWWRYSRTLCYGIALASYISEPKEGVTQTWRGDNTYLKRELH